MALTPATDTVLGLVPPQRPGNAAALNDTMQELGNAVGVAVVGTVLARHSGAAGAGARIGAAAGTGFTAAAAIVALGALLAAALLPGPERGADRTGEPVPDRI